MARGEPRSFLDPRLGELTEVRREAGGAWCLWHGRHLIEGHDEPTHVSLSGSHEGPYGGLLAAVHAVLDGLEAIAAKVDAELAERASAASFHDFRLRSITDWDMHDEVLQLELVPIRRGILAHDVELYWPGDDWALHHHVVLRRDRPAAADPP